MMYVYILNLELICEDSCCYQEMDWNLSYNTHLDLSHQLPENLPITGKRIEGVGSSLLDLHFYISEMILCWCYYL